MNCDLLNFKFDTIMIPNFYFYLNFQTFKNFKIDLKFYLNFPLFLKPYNWKLHKHAHMCTHLSLAYQTIFSNVKI